MEEFWDFDNLENNFEYSSEPDLYKSLLQVYRDEGRERFLRESLGNLKDKPRSHQTNVPGTITPKSSRNKNSDSRRFANNIYSEFLNYKRNATTADRFKEYDETLKNRSFTKVKTHPETRRYDRFSDPPVVPKNTSWPNDVERRFNEDLELSNLIGEGTEIDWKQKIPEKYTKEHSEEPPEIQEVDPAIDLLITDQYYPGFIDDAINRKLDFNKIVFDISFGDNNISEEEPEKVPLSLIEAFDLRVEYETGAKKKEIFSQPRLGHIRNLPEDLHKKSFISFIQETVNAPTHQNLISREEMMLASTVGIDISTAVRNKPINEITQAINCLQRAEFMNNYDKSLRVAEEAYDRAPPDLAESAAVYGASGFTTIGVTEKKISMAGDQCYRPIEVVAYVGITKPSADTVQGVV